MRDYRVWKKSFFAVVALVLVFCLISCTTLEEKRDKFMAQGKASFEKGDYVNARLYFKNALQVDPKLAEGHLWLGKTDLRLQNPQGAFGSLSKAVELKPDLFEAQILLGSLLLLGKQVDQAEAKASLVLVKEPKNTDALTLLAAVAMARQQPEKATEILKKVMGLDAHKIKAYLMQSTIESQQKKPEVAAAILEEGIKANPKATVLYLVRARLAEQQKNYAQAEAFLQKVQDLTPKDVRLQSELARLYILTKKWDKAEQALRRKTELEPDQEAHVGALARFLSSRGHFEKGEKALQDFIARHPENIKAKLVLANFYLTQRKLGRAERVLQEIADRDPAGPNGLKAKGELAALRLTEGRNDEADNLVEEVLKVNPKDMMALKLQGLLALTNKKGLQAVNDFRILTQDQPENPENWLLLARAHLVNKEPTLAKEAAKKAINLKPDYLEARGFLYGIYLQEKDYDGVIKIIKDSLRANDKDLANWGFLGDIYLLKGDGNQAQAAYQKMIALEPNNLQGYLKMAFLSQKTKQPTIAVQYLGRALHQIPDAYQALRLLVAIYLEQKQPAKALEAARTAVARAPKNAEMHQILGEVLLIQKQPEAAAAALEQALTLNPYDAQALRLLVNAYEGLPDKNKALKKLKEKAADPRAPIFNTLALAQIYEQQRDGDKAISLYNRLLERQIAPIVVKNNLAYLLAEYQPTPENLARAQKLATEVLDDNPENPRLLDTMGWIYCRQGKYTQAKRYLERAAAKIANNPTVQYHLGYCAAKLGETDNARKALTNALAAKGNFPERGAAQKLLEGLKATGK